MHGLHRKDTLKFISPQRFKGVQIMVTATKKLTPTVEITADMIKAVRNATGAGTLDCKDFLLATKGDVDKAIARIYIEGKTGPKRVWV